MHTRMHTRTHTRTHANTHPNTHAYTLTCACKHTPTCAHAHTRTRACAHMRTAHAHRTCTHAHAPTDTILAAIASATSCHNDAKPQTCATCSRPLCAHAAAPATLQSNKNSLQLGDLLKSRDSSMRPSLRDLKLKPCIHQAS
mmetsp:Transcript_11965/g.20206  ORF Transcript_11965/g.20206 Transcript_11965/m.20206 type:complete len:142 (+) Transcript_11965:162-587(+)